MVAMQLGQVHTLPPSQLAAHQAAVERSFVDVRTSLAALAKQVPHGEVYKVCAPMQADRSGRMYGRFLCAMPCTPQAWRII